MGMKVLLIKPSINIKRGYGREAGVPLGLAYIAAMLEKYGHEVAILDLSILDFKGDFETRKAKRNQFIKQMLEKENPDVLGLTCNTAERFDVFSIADFVKENFDVPIVAGGIHVTFTAEETLRDSKSIDIILRGESEYTVVELCENLEKNRGLENIRGITFRNKNNKIISTLPRPFIEDLDSLPFPARHLLDIEAYPIRMPASAGLWKYKVTNAISSRGCPFECAYCSTTLMWGRKIRFRSPKNFVDELELVHNTYSFLDGFTLSDDNFTVNRERVLKICEEIKKRRLDIVWDCYAHIHNISDELVKNMASAGCKLIAFGVESASERMLRIMNKPEDITYVKKAVQICKKYGVLPKCNFMFGYPGETEKDVRQTLEFIDKYLNPNEALLIDHIFIFPETAVFRDLLESGYFGENFSWMKRDFPSYKNMPLYIPQNDKQRVKMLKNFRTRHRLKYAIRHPVKAIPYISDPRNIVKDIRWLMRKGC